MGRLEVCVISRLKGAVDGLAVGLQGREPLGTASLPSAASGAGALFQLEDIEKARLGVRVTSGAVASFGCP